MDELLALLSKGKAGEVRRIAKERLAKDKGDAEAWFMLGMAAKHEGDSMRAMECYTRALYSKVSQKYLKAIAHLHMERFEFEAAANHLHRALGLKKDADVNFMLGVCYLFLDSPKARLHIREAWRIDPERTRKLLREFYNDFFRDDEGIPEEEKKAILERLSRSD